MPQAVTAGVVYLMNAGLSMAAAQVVVYGSMAIAAGYTTVKTAEAKARRAENAARRKAANRAQEIQNMQFGTVAARRFIYGQTITNGHLVFQETAGTDNKDLYRVLYLGEGPIQSADQLFFNEEEITALSGTLDSTAGASVNSGTYNGYLDVQVGKNGGAGANVPTSLTSKLASNTSWTSNHKMTGNSWLAYKVVHNNEVWTSGVPNVRVRVNGRRVYDPRLDGTNGGSGSHRYNDETTWAYSNNSALCVLDFLINGMKVDIDDLDIASFQAAASTCDDNITIINSSGTSTTEKRYTTNGVAFLDEEVISTLEELLIPCHGSLIEEGGTIRLLVPGASTTVTANLTEDDLISELSIKVNAQISSRMNKVGGSFTSAEENYQEVDFSPISSSALIADDGREHIQELSLAMVTSESHAQRIASIVLKENALTNSINVTLKPEFAYLRVGDIVTLTFQPEVIGGTGSDSILTNATKFQVVSYSLQPSGEIAVELQEYNDSSYVWNTADHDYVTRTALADSFIETIDKPTFGTPVASNYLDEAGNQVLAFNVPLTPASHPNFAFTSVGLGRIGVASNGVETGIDLVEGKRAGPEDDNLKFSNLSTQIEPGHANTYVSYKFKLFGRTYIENGKRSAARELDVTSYIAVDTTAPARPTSFTATGGLNQITLNWVNPTDIDFDKVKVFRHTSNSSGASTEIGETRGTSFVDAGLSNSTQRYYWIKSVDKVGNLSAFRGQVNATTGTEPPAGLNSATVFLFKKNSNDSSPPSSFSGTFNYNFNTGALSGGTLNSWTQSAPSLGVGEYLWQRTASVSSTSTTTTLATTAFSTASIVGRAGPTAVTISLFNKNSSPSSAPSTFTGTLTYSVDTGVLTLPGTMNGWSETAPSLSQGEYLWGRFYTFTTSALTETMTNSDFSSGSVVGLAGPTGPTGDDGEPAIAEILKYKDLQTSGTVTTSGKWKISNSLSATPTTSGVATWSTSVQSLFLHGSDSNGDSRNRFIESLLPGDFCTFTSTQSGKTGRALFKIISISESSNIYTLRIETTVVTGTLSSLTTSSGTIVNFGFSRSDTAGLTVQNGLLIDIDQNPVDKNDATFRQAAPAGSNGGNNSNLSRAFLNVNTNISEMSQIPDRSRVWAKFVMSGSPNNFSYRLWDVISQTWSNHALQVGNADDPQPIFAETLISKEAILQHVDAIELDVRKININENINLGDGAAWSTGDKITPADNTKNGLYFGNPSSASENYAFATTGGVTLDSNNNPVLTNSHGVLFDKNITEIRNPTILKGATTLAGVQTLNGPAPTSLSSSDWSSTSATKNTDSVTIPANCSVLYIEGVAGGGGGDGAQNNATNTTAHRTGKNSLFRLKDGSTILVQETATGGTPGEGVPSAKTDGTPGQASTFASGGNGGGGNGDGGNGTLGSGGGGGGGRDASAWTTSRKGGIGGNAGGSISRTLNITDIKAQNNISASATLTLELEAGTGGRYSGEVNYGEGGYGGAGFMSYNIETTGLEDVTLLSDSEYKAGTVGRLQSWQSITLAQNVWVANPDDQPVQVCFSQGVAGGGTSYFQIADDSSGTNSFTISQKSDDNATDLLAAAIIPVGKYFRQTNHAGYVASILRT